MPSLEPTNQMNYVNHQQLQQLHQQQINTNSSPGPFTTRLRTHNSQLNSSQLHRPEVPGYGMSYSGNEVQLEAECRRSPHQAQPYLINLDRRGNKTPLFRYPLPMGVTMLGTGRACVKPPDIVLHGPTVAPQHCFIERREDEITLHPISELTILDDALISQPTPLVSGNVISIGESHVFRFESPQAQAYQTPSQILYDSPYAVIVSGAGNPSRTAGDVNKNSFHTMEIMEASLAQTVRGAGGHNEGAASPSSILKLTTGEDSGAKKYRDGLESDNFVSKVARFEYLAHTQRPPPFPTANSVFPPPHNAYTNVQQQQNPTTNLINGKQSFELDYSREETQHHYQSRTSSHTNGNNYSPDNDSNHRSEQTNGFPNKSGYSFGIRHQQPAYNNYSHRPCYSAEEYNNNSLVSSNDNSSDRIPLSYRRAYSDLGPSNTYENTFSPMTSDTYYASTSNTQLEQEHNSSPSPDSLSSTNTNHLNQTFYTKQLNGNSTSTNINTNTSYSRNINGLSGSHTYSNTENLYENSIACETLLEMKRKQAQEARHAAQVTENSDKLRLEEILEMCAEYEHQIARELEERRKQTTTTPNTTTTTQQPNSTLVTPPKANHSNGQATSQVIRTSHSTSASGDEKSPGTPNSLYYSRIKTNGSLPREKKIGNGEAARRPPSGSNNVITDEEIASIFTFNISDTSSCNSNYYSNSLTNGNGYGSLSGGDDDVFSPRTATSLSATPNKDGVNSPSLSTTGTPEELRNNKSPYENIMNLNQNGKYVPTSPQETPSQEHQSCRTRIKTTVTAVASLSPPTTTTSPSNSNNSFSNGKTPLEVKETNYPRRPIITTVLEPIHSSCSSSPTSSTASSSSFNNSSSCVSMTQSNGTVNVRNGRAGSNSGSNSSNSNNNIDKIERCETPPKSKLSVSFAKSVEEYHDFQNEDENGEEGTNGNSTTNDRHLSRNVRIENNSNSNASRTKESFSRPIVKTIATEVQVHVEDCSSNNNSNNKNNSESPSLPSISFNNWTQSCKPETETEISSGSGSPSHSNSSHRIDNASFSTEANGTDNDSTSNASTRTTESSSSPYQICIGDDFAHLKKEIGEVEQQEMELLREMEIEKALLVGEEKSLETQLQADKIELDALKERLAQIDESHRRWRMDSLERIGELKGKLKYSEKELQRLDRMQEEFCGSTDEETVLLERLKFQHELVESDRKGFEDAEFHHMEQEVNKEAQREELSKTLSEAGRKLLADQLQLEQLKSQNRISFSSSSKEIQNLEKKRQKLIKELQRLRESAKPTADTLNIPDSHTDNLSDSEEMKNSDLEEKLRALALSNLSAEDAIRIERIKSRSPIDPTLGGTMGPKTCETLRAIERNREFLLNEQGVQMLEEERQRVRELQKRVQDAVREEWEASRKSRSNQCQSLNSVGSDDSTQTISDTPTTDSGCSDDATTDKSGAPSLSTTDVSLNGTGNGLCGIDMEMAIGGALGQNSFELCQQMRQKQRDMSQSFEETRPLSDGSAYDNGSTIVTMRDKHRVQNRPLTRYLPVRGDEDHFDLRAHIETSGHQLELCPHVIVTSSTARGFLSKLGSRFHNWNKRWFVFDRDTRTFSYYSDKNEKKPRGGIHFQAIEEVYVDHLQSVKSPIPKLTFCVKTYSRVFHLLAPSAEAMRIWIDIIFTGAEGYQEFKCGP